MNISKIIRIVLSVALVSAIWVRVDWTVGLFAFLSFVQTEAISAIYDKWKNS